MKKNGFTLIELIVTIALLSAVALVMVLNYSSLQKNNNKKECERIISTFETSAEVYSELGNTISSEGISLTALMERGLIESGIINPVTKTPFDYANTVNYNEDTKTYYFSVTNICG